MCYAILFFLVRLRENEIKYRGYPKRNQASTSLVMCIYREIDIKKIEKGNEQNIYSYTYEYGLTKIHIYIYIFIYLFIPPGLWATGRLQVVSIKYQSPYPLPGPPIQSIWITRGVVSFLQTRGNAPRELQTCAGLIKYPVSVLNEET